MYDVLELYAWPYCEREPVICLDEKSKQLIRDSREGPPMKPGSLAKYDYEYVREGTCNVFVAVEPKGGRRVVKVTARRTKPDFVGFVQYSTCLNAVMPPPERSTWFWTTSTPVSAPASTRSLVRRPLARC